MQRGLQILPLVVPEFSRQYPYIKLELVEQGSATLERMTAEGQCDLALIATNEKPNRLRYVLIENEEVVLMVARSTDLAHRFDDGTPIEITEARSERFISMHEGHSVRTIQDRLFERHHLSPTILMETTNMEAGKHVRAAAGADVGACQLRIPRRKRPAKCFALGARIKARRGHCRRQARVRPCRLHLLRHARTGHRAAAPAAPARPPAARRPPPRARQ